LDKRTAHEQAATGPVNGGCSTNRESPAAADCSPYRTEGGTTTTYFPNYPVLKNDLYGCLDKSIFARHQQAKIFDGEDAKRNGRKNNMSQQPTKQPISRRKFLKAAGISGAALILGACSPAAAPNVSQATELPATKAASGKVTELSVQWENWGEIFDNLMVNIGTDFEKENADLKMKWDFPPDQATKFLTMAAAGTPPEIVFLRPNSMATLAKKNVLIPMDNLVDGAGYKREDFVTPIYNTSVLDGKLFAIPGAGDCYGLGWSKDIYKELGMDPEKPPATLDELIDHSKTILTKDNNGDITRLGYGPGANDLFYFIYFFGGRFYDEKTQKVVFNEEPIQEVFQKIYDYVKELDINKLAAFQKRPGLWEAGNAFSSKQAAFAFDGYWVYDPLDKYSPDIDYGFTTWPTKTGEEDLKNYYMNGWMVGIPKGTKFSGEAWRFIKYGFIDQAAKMGVDTLNNPAWKPALTDWETGARKALPEKNRMAPYLDVFVKIGNLATKNFPPLPVNQYYNDEISRIFDLILRDQVTIKEGLDEVTKNVQAELDKA
jgi:multiple sugar transport system substrate-binding protein